MNWARDQEVGPQETARPVRRARISWPLPVHVAVSDQGSGRPGKPVVRLDALPAVPESSFTDAWKEANRPVFVVGEDDDDPAVLADGRADRNQDLIQHTGSVEERVTAPPANKVRRATGPMTVKLGSAWMLMQVEEAGTVDRPRSNTHPSRTQEEASAVNRPRSKTQPGRLRSKSIFKEDLPASEG